MPLFALRALVFGTFAAIASHGPGLLAQTLQDGLDNPSHVGPFTNQATDLDGTIPVPSGLWRYDASESHNGEGDSVISVLPNRSRSLLRTTVQGPAVVSFWWKMDAAATGDTLRFSSWSDNVGINNSVPFRNTWQQQSVQVDFGEQPMQWLFERFSSLPIADGRAWIDQLVVTPMENVPELQTAVDNSSYDIFSTDWILKELEGATNGSLARSGPVGDSGKSSMMLQVQGPATVSFDWGMVADPDGYSEMVFSVNGQEYDYLSYESQLQTRTFDLGPGAHVLKFTYDLSYTSFEYEGLSEGHVDNLVIDAYGENPGLAEALERPGGVYSQNWYYQTGVTQDGSDAAAVQATQPSVQRRMYIDLPDEPGLLTFWSKTQLEPAYGYLFFRLDGGFVGIGGGGNTQTGSTDWVKTELNLGPGNNRVLEAVLVRGPATATSPQLTFAFLDQVVFRPGVTNYQPDLAIGAKRERNLRGIGLVNQTGAGQVARVNLRPRRLGEKFDLQVRNLSGTDSDQVRLLGQGNRRQFRVMFIVPFEGKLFDYSKPFHQGSLSTVELDPNLTEQFEVWISRTRRTKRRIHNFRIIGTSTTDPRKIDVVRTRVRIPR